VKRAVVRPGADALRVFGEGRRGRWRRTVARRLVAAALAGGAVLSAVAVARTPEAGPAVTVLVASRDLAAGHLLGPGDVRVQRRPAGYAPQRPGPGIGEAVGRRLSGPLGTGEAVTSERLLGPGMLAGRPDGEVAVHVVLGDPGALAMLRPGDRVDVLSGTAEPVARSALVLAVDRPADSGGLGAAGPIGGAGNGLVVATSPESARRLAVPQGDDPGGLAFGVVLQAETEDA
jgi:Flp pilus assembly protein CpaB